MRAAAIVPALLLAAAVAAPAAEWGTQTRWLWSGGKWRSFLLHVPWSYDGRPMPLVVAFHGFSGSGAAQESVTGFSGMAPWNRFIVAYPDALPHPEMRGASWLTPDGGLADGNAAFVGEMVGAIRAQYAVDARRIHATGMSQGGAMSYYCASAYPQVFAAIAPVVVSIPTSIDLAGLLPDRPVPVLMMNGTLDHLIPYQGGIGVNGVDFRATPALAASLAAHDGCSPVPSRYDLPNWHWFDGCTASVTHYRSGLQGSEVILYTITGGGHTWPGSRTWLPEFIFGNTCKDFDGSQVIWDFFTRHPMPAGVAN